MRERTKTPLPSSFPTPGSWGSLKPREMSPLARRALPSDPQCDPLILQGGSLPKRTALWEGRGSQEDRVGRGFVKASQSLSLSIRPKQGSQFLLLLESHKNEQEWKAESFNP